MKPTRKLNQEERIEFVLKNYIKNVHPDKEEELRKEYIDKDIPATELEKLIREKLGISRPINKYCEEYWTLRGWACKPKSLKHKTSKPSPFSREYWLEKGYSEKEADYKRNSLRPIRKEYWLEKGYSEEESIKLAKETKSSNNKKGANKSKNREKDDFRNSSVRCIEYWLSYHMGDEEAAKESLREVQATFTLEKCITKHGKIKGYEVWRQRQDKWQQTLNSKSEEEILDINRKKNSFSIDVLYEKGYNRFEIQEILSNHGTLKSKEELISSIRDNWKLRVKNIDELFESMPKAQWAAVGVFDIIECREFVVSNVPNYIPDVSKYDEPGIMGLCNALGYTDDEIIEFLFNRKNIKTLTKEEFIEKNSKDEFFIYKGHKRIYDAFTPHQWFVLGVKDFEDCVKFLDENFNILNDATVLGKMGYGTRIETPHGLLRSKFEYKFYKCLLENGITDFEIEKRYPDSNMLCDFYINGIYIEIAPMYNYVEKYRIKMDRKKELFGSILITTNKASEYQEIIEGLFKKD